MSLAYIVAGQTMPLGLEFEQHVRQGERVIANAKGILNNSMSI